MAILMGAIHTGREKLLKPFEADNLLVRVAAAG
jgi:hypothetical protein